MQFEKIAHTRGPFAVIFLFLSWLLPSICDGSGPPPLITVQPLSETVPKGGTAIFTVVATSSTTLSYQWFFASKLINGATSSTLTLSNVGYTNGGKYYVAVQNAGGTVNSTRALLTVTNAVPVALNDAYITLENLPLTVAAPGVLANDTDIDGDSLTAVLVTTASHGSLTLNTNGAFTYTPATNYSGIDSFTYQPNDGAANGNIATVILTVTHVNQAPVANSQSVVLPNWATTNLVLTATDVDSPALIYAILSGPTNGSLSTLDPTTGSVTYIPATNYYGNDSFSFTAFDGSLYSTGQVNLTIIAPPSITTSPWSQKVLVGQNASLSVVATGTVPLSYQWQLNGIGLVSGTNSTLALTNVQPSDGGSYTVVVTNVAGAATSVVAMLTVYAPPAITTQPLSQTTTQGLTASFSVAASGTAPPSYQWQFSGRELPGETNSTLVLTNVQFAQAGDYSVTVTSILGRAFSAPAFLSVVSWAAQYNLSSGNAAYLQQAAVDAQGNVYVTGYAGTSGNKGLNYVTIKYDANGNSVWRAVYNGPLSKADDQASALALDSAGNVYVTGSSLGTNGWDYATVKYDTNGNQLWVARYDGVGASNDLARAVAVDTNGNVFVTGSSMNATGAYQYATVKYDSGGNQLWVRTYAGPDGIEDDAISLALDPAGNVFVTGQSKGRRSDFDYATIKYSSDGTQLWVAWYDGPGNGPDSPVQVVADARGNAYVTGSAMSTSTNFDYATIKYGSNGNQLWVAYYDGPAGKNDYAAAMAVDGTGNVFVTGSSETNTGVFDYATVKYDALGKQIWVQRYDFGDDDEATALGLDLNGNVYVTGKSRGINTGYDFATIKYEAGQGTQLTVERFNSSSNVDDTPLAVAVDNQYNVYVAGQGFNPLGFAVVKYSYGVLAPSVSTLAASNVASGSAVLNGIVDPQGTSTTYWVQYGLTTNYGSWSASTGLAPGSNSVPVSTLLSGLSPGTLYHYCIVATNAIGVTVGQDMTFTTLDLSPGQLTGNLISPGRDLQLLLTNAPGGGFTVLRSADLTLPLSNWTAIGPMLETSPGRYQFTDLQSPTNVLWFYRIRSP